MQTGRHGQGRGVVQCAINPAGTFAVALAAPHFLVANDPVLADSREHRTHTYTPQLRVWAYHV
jgi:hypothetical protein